MRTLAVRLAPPVTRAALVPVGARETRESIAVSDLAIAAFIFACMVALAITAPIWGYDSRDGVESDQSARRISWLHDRSTAQPGRATSVMVAGALRSVAHRIDARASAPALTDVADPRLAEAC